MSKNKIVIDLRRTPLTPDQTTDLHAALHKTIVSQLKKAAAAPPPPKSKAKLAVAAAPQTAVLTVTITGTNPGLSNISANLNGTVKSITKSGTISFDNVNSGDIIAISGDSLGTTSITISVSADPINMNFPPGHINGNFFIN